MSEFAEKTMAGFTSEGRRRLVAYVGSYASDPVTGGGGIYAFEVSAEGRHLTALSRIVPDAERKSPGET